MDVRYFLWEAPTSELECIFVSLLAFNRVLVSSKNTNEYSIDVEKLVENEKISPSYNTVRTITQFQVTWLRIKSGRQNLPMIM